MNTPFTNTHRGGNIDASLHLPLSPSTLDARHYIRDCFRGHRSFVNLNLAIITGTLTLFVVNQFILKPFTVNVVVHNYFNDLLAMGILLPWTNLCLLCYPYRDIRLQRASLIILLSLAAGLFWEYVTPLYLSRSTSDGWDLVAYLIGGTVYALVLCRQRCRGNHSPPH